MAPEAEYPYSVRIETARGECIDIPIAFLTSKQLATFLQVEFKRLVREASLYRARVHVEAAVTTDYGKMLGEVAACLRKAGAKLA